MVDGLHVHVHLHVVVGIGVGVGVGVGVATMSLLVTPSSNIFPLSVKSSSTISMLAKPSSIIFPFTVTKFLVMLGVVSYFKVFDWQKLVVDLT